MTGPLSPLSLAGIWAVSWQETSDTRHSLPNSLSPSLFLSLSFALSVSPPLSLPLPSSLSPFFSLSHPCLFPLSPYLSLSLSLPLSPSLKDVSVVSPHASRSPPPPLSLSLSLSLLTLHDGVGVERGHVDGCVLQR